MSMLFFIKKLEIKFAIIIIYVDDLNLEELIETAKYLKREFKIKDLEITKQIKHFPNRVLVHQSTYIKKIIKCFNIDIAHPLSSSMVV